MNILFCTRGHYHQSSLSFNRITEGNLCLTFGNIEAWELDGLRVVDHRGQPWVDVCRASCIRRNGYVQSFAQSRARARLLLVAGRRRCDWLGRRNLFLEIDQIVIGKLMLEYNKFLFYFWIEFFLYMYFVMDSRITFTDCCSTTTATEGGALASSLTSSSMTNWPCRNNSNSCFSTSGFKRLFFIRILRLSRLGDGRGTPGSSYFITTIFVMSFFFFFSSIIWKFAMIHNTSRCII